MTTNLTTPQWRIEQEREMDRHAYSTHMHLARLYAWQAQHAPTEEERAIGRTYTGVHLTAALAFSEGGPEA